MLDHRHHPWILICTLAGLVGAGLPGANAHAANQPPQPATAVAIFAGGCFWCMEPPFDKLDGVRSTTSGYIGGDVDKPTYRQVSAGATGHAEAVKIVYDSSMVGYEQLLDVFWRNIDPTVADRQFCDVGSQYRTAVFATDPAQFAAAKASKARIAALPRFADATIFTEVVTATTFYPAETEHQDYYKKNPLRYKFYRLSCGRDRRLAAVWDE